jgi:hypothetical protein
MMTSEEIRVVCANPRLPFSSSLSHTIVVHSLSVLVCSFPYALDARTPPETFFFSSCRLAEIENAASGSGGGEEERGDEEEGDDTRSDGDGSCGLCCCCVLLQIQRGCCAECREHVPYVAGAKWATALAAQAARPSLPVLHHQLCKFHIFFTIISAAATAAAALPPSSRDMVSRGEHLSLWTFIT